MRYEEIINIIKETDSLEQIIHFIISIDNTLFKMNDIINCSNVELSEEVVNIKNELYSIKEECQKQFKKIDKISKEKQIEKIQQIPSDLIQATKNDLKTILNNIPILEVFAHITNLPLAQDITCQMLLDATFMEEFKVFLKDIILYSYKDIIPLRLKNVCTETLRIVERILNKRRKTIRCIETNVSYEDLDEAHEATGVSKNGIYSCCIGKQNTCGSYHWKYEYHEIVLNHKK